MKATICTESTLVTHFYFAKPLIDTLLRLSYQMAYYPQYWDISYYSLVTFKTKLSKCFGYSCLFIYTTKFLKILFLVKFIFIKCKE